MNNKTITRADLLDSIYNACPTLSRTQVRDIMELMLREVSQALLRGESVNLRSFGSFQTRSKRQRIGRNPRTGVEAVITPRRVMTFKPSPSLVETINQPETSTFFESPSS